MASEGNGARGPTSPAHDVYEVMFQGADLVSSFWQPFLKGAGRWQLEMAQLATKQTRAALGFSHTLARSRSPDQLVEAYRNYWNEVSSFYSDASRNIATALVRAAPHAAVLELPLHKPREHDTLQLVDSAYQRKVA